MIISVILSSTLAWANAWEILLPIIKDEVTQAEAALSYNKVSQKEEIERVKIGLRGILEALETRGVSKHNGLDAELRPAYVIMQGIIERAQTIALEKGYLSKIEACIITPRMPTPLMLAEGCSLKDVQLNDPLAFAYYRHTSLHNFLKTGSRLECLYSSSARATLANETPELKNYDNCLAYYPNLIDFPLTNIPMESFPKHLSGAFYCINDDLYISIQSRQVSQADGTQAHVWAIKTGTPAEKRATKVRNFINGTLVVRQNHEIMQDIIERERLRGACAP